MNLFGKIFHKRDRIQIAVPVIFFEEDGIHYANIPPLDLIGYGNSEKEARSSLDVMVEEFIKYTTEHKTLETELRKLGWQHIESPSLTELIDRNDQLKNIINNRPIRTDRININMPAAFA
jgi:hypothetical protein